MNHEKGCKRGRLCMNHILGSLCFPAPQSPGAFHVARTRGFPVFSDFSAAEKEQEPFFRLVNETMKLYERPLRKSAPKNH